MHQSVSGASIKDGVGRHCVVNTGGRVTAAVVAARVCVARYKDSNHVTSGLFFETLLSSCVANFSHKSVLHIRVSIAPFFLEFMSRRDDAHSMTSNRGWNSRTETRWSAVNGTHNFCSCPSSQTDVQRPGSTPVMWHRHSACVDTVASPHGNIEWAVEACPHRSAASWPKSEKEYQGNAQLWQTDGMHRSVGGARSCLSALLISAHFAGAPVQKASLICTLKDHLDDINWCAFSGSLLATCSGDKTVRVYNTSDFSELPFSPLTGHGYGVHCCCFSACGRLLASCSTDATTLVWSMESGDVEAVLEHPGRSPVRICAVSADSLHLVSGASDGSLALWDFPSKQLKRWRQIKHHNDRILMFAQKPRNRLTEKCSATLNWMKWMSVCLILIREL